MSRRSLYLFVGLLASLLLLASLTWLGGELLRPIPPTPTVTPTPAPTPVGGANGLIAFTSTRDGNSEIYVMNADGSNQRNLTNDPAENVSPAWSPDGQRLAFLRVEPRAVTLLVVNADGGSLKQLASIPTASSISWSPDGQILIMDQFSRQGASWLMQWAQVKADGTGPATPLFEQMPADCFALRGSPDGASYAALCRSRPLPRLWLIAGDGDAKEIAHGVTTFDWSPDGRRLAVFSNDPTSGAAALSTFEPMSGAWEPLHRLTDLPLLGAPSELRWSPDGSRLAFGAGAWDDSSIYLLWADGSGITRLTASGNNHSPRWSPDGQWLAYASNANAPMPTAGVFTTTETLSSIFVVNIEDAFRDPASLQPIQLTFTGQDYAPQWQP
jgi:Tol biopolymer transport system component